MSRRVSSSIAIVLVLAAATIALTKRRYVIATSVYDAQVLTTTTSLYVVLRTTNTGWTGTIADSVRRLLLGYFGVSSSATNRLDTLMLVRCTDNALSLYSLGDPNIARFNVADDELFAYDSKGILKWSGDRFEPATLSAAGSRATVGPKRLKTNGMSLFADLGATHMRLSFQAIPEGDQLRRVLEIEIIDRKKMDVWSTRVGERVVGERQYRMCFTQGQCDSA